MNQQATLTSSLMARFPVLERLRAIPKPALIGAIAAVAALVVAATMWSRDPN
jgi:flagellar M-ring protein FliF